ncbi:N-acetylmuramoyl-L-alanine amidase [Pinisolibacter sp.]|uniref:N-acetylmuramoyl-L-alanine amidase n=1 Tax=Pinisolibacter sp. TaxID=2172024 RepID=UPI002FDED39C
MNGETARPSAKTPTRDGRPGRSLTLAAAAFCLLIAAVAPAATAPAESLDRIGDLLSSGLRGAAPASEPATVRPAAQGAPDAAAADDRVLSLSGWSIGGDDSRTVVTVDLSHPAPARVFTLLTPTRVVVDLPAARFDDASGGARVGRGLVAAWRFGALTAHRSRLVLDTRATVRVTRAEFDSAAPAGKTRLVVEMVGASRDEMRRAGAIDVGAAPAAAQAASPQRSEGGSAPVAARPVVVIDAGHGGGDAGTVSPATGMPEKTVVLEMSKTLVRRLRETGRYEVVATREDDVFLGLGERVRIARARHADLFLSIHADAEYDHSVRGATIYTVAETASDEKAAALAAKENQSDSIAGHVVEEAEPEVADILADLTLRETRHLSHRFARDLLDEYRRHGRLVKSQPHRQAGLKVLRAHDIPSALVELGFLSNKEDEALLTSPEWREKTAASLISAIDRYFVGRNALAGPAKDGGGRAPASP